MNKIHQITLLLPPCNIVQWLSKEKQNPKFYWANRDHSEEYACSGAIDILRENRKLSLAKTLLKIETLTGQNQALFYCGGLAFNQKVKVAAHWRHFGRWYFFLPRLVLKREKDSYSLSINIYETEDKAEWNKKLELMASDIASNYSVAQSLVPKELQVRKTCDQPSYQQWLTKISQIQRAITDKQYEKVVLARESSFRLQKPASPEGLLSILAAPGNSYDYYLQINPQTAYLGRSPELLFKRTGSNIYTEAIAGSLLWDKNNSEPDHKDLLDDQKNSVEHAFVVDFISGQLQKLCKSISEPSEINTLKQPGLLHLYSCFEGLLKPEISDAKLINYLHPTPAVGGYPRRRIVNTIAKLEDFNRGWYAAPIGMISKSNTTMAVGIRSLLQAKNNVYLFAGAGITKDSVASAEWSELQQKVRQYESIFLKPSK